MKLFNIDLIALKVYNTITYEYYLKTFLYFIEILHFTLYFFFYQYKNKGSLSLKELSIQVILLYQFFIGPYFFR